MKTNKKRGFSLAELMMAATIIAILTALILTNLNNNKKRSRDAIRLGDLKSLSLAAQRYFSEHFEFPDSISDLDQYFATGAPGSAPKDPLSASDPDNWWYNYKKYNDPTTDAPRYCFLARLETSSAPVISSDSNGICYTPAGYGHNYAIKGP